MKRLVLLVSLFFMITGLLTTASLFAQPGTSGLTGTVIDSASNKPLAGVSVFLNSTSIGTITHADGSFVLGTIPRGKYQLVISAIGYETFVTGISGNQPHPAIQVILHPKATELAAFTVEPWLKDGWQRFGNIFLDNFIGKGENAGSCKIKNKDAVRFHFSRKNNLLTVTATEPLIIENDALGYTVEYRLVEFSCSFRTNIVMYFGYPFFREMSTGRQSRQRRWEEHRQTAFAGSMMHFMRSLYSNRLAEEGFIAQHPVTVPNTEKGRIKGIYHPDTQKLDTFPIDTLHYFWQVLKQPDVFTRTARIGADSLITIYPDQTRSLFFTGKMTVIYRDPKKGIEYRSSTIYLITPAMIMIEENGNYYPPQEILTSGFWGQSEKVSNLLPMDYGQH
ncbi:MAG TPA: carboxypeptidase-like regulatory domain-containing protein [Puia sp.]|jgi:hypothetical protein